MDEQPDYEEQRMGATSAKLEEFAEYRRLAGVDEIGRRVLANNSFDGVLTIIGVLMGSYVAGVKDPRIVLSTGLATCVAMGISGFWGAYMAESAERKHSMRELEQAMLSDLSHSKQARASRFAVVVVSVLDGLSPLIAGMIALLPFLFSAVWGDIMYTYVASLVVALAALFALGAFLAKIAQDSVARSGFRMVLAGLVCVGLSFLLSTGS